MQLTTAPDIDTPAPRFLPADFDPTDLAALAAQVQRLLDRPLDSADALARWLEDGSELLAVVKAGRTRRMVAMNRDTRDPVLKEAHLAYQRDVVSAWRRHADRIDRKYLACPHRADLGAGYAVFDRARANAAALFQERNVPLHARASELSARYQELKGAVMVEWDGDTLTAQGCMAKFDDLDRSVRARAFRALAARHAEDREAIDDIYDEIVRVRDEIARNAGFDDYVRYRFRELERFDYTPEDCRRFHEAIEQAVVPVARRAVEHRRDALGLDAVRFYDQTVSLTGAPPARLFEDQDAYVALMDRLFRAVDPRFADEFDVLARNGMLDLMARPGKAPGGYNTMVEDVRVPFIFWNAVGRREDLRVMLHEGGHAFHSLAARGQPLADYRRAPTEFCEVASMAMELFGLERLGEVFDADAAREIAYGHHERMLCGFPGIAVIDAFQQWVYENPGHDRDERRATWVHFRRRFATGVDWSDCEDVEADYWQWIPHLFGAPLYYVEYAIARLGSLQLWVRARQDPEGAVAAYRRALALGGSRPLPELFEAAEIEFNLDAGFVGELMTHVEDALQDMR